MDFNDSEEDCTIYIEELKSDDPNLKINAVVKIQKISEILGPLRVRDELIPYLIEIIEELDNEDEFLIKLADQVTGLTEYVGGKQYTHLLISPLEILSSLEENAVREKSVESLKEISKNQLETFYSNHFLPMVKQLAGWDNYPSRISAGQLIGSCYERFQDDEKTQILQLFADLCKDDTPMVRRTAAEMMSVLCGKISQKSIIINDIIPLWKKLIVDDIDSVKVKSIEGSLEITKKISKQEVSSHILPGILDIIKKRNTNIWRIRYAIAEIASNLIQYLDKEITRRDLLSLYEELLKDPEQEVKSISIQNLPELCKQLTPQMLANQILPIFNTLVQDQSQHVRSSLAEVICKIANNFEKQSVTSGIIPIVETLLKDEIIEVRLMVLSNIYLLNCILGEDNIQKYIVPLFTQIQQEKQWRYRFAFCELLPKFRSQLGFESFKKQFQETIVTFALDHYFHIREQNFKNLKDIAYEIGFQKLKPIFEELVDKLISSKNYIYRISILQGTLELKELMTEREVNEYFSRYFEILREEKVPNVILNLIKYFIKIKESLNAQNQNSFAEYCQSLLQQQEQDSDVQYYANLVVEEQ